MNKMGGVKDSQSSGLSTINSKHTLSTRARISIRDKILATGGMRKQPRVSTRGSTPSTCPNSEPCSSQTSSTLTITDNSETILSKKISSSDTEKALSSCCGANRKSCSAPREKQPPTTTQRAIKTMTKCAKLAYRKVPSICTQLGGASSTKDSAQPSKHVLECMNCQSMSPIDVIKVHRRVRKDKLREMKKRREKRIGASTANRGGSDSPISSPVSRMSGQEISAAIAATRKKKKYRDTEHSSASSMSGDKLVEVWKKSRKRRKRKKKNKVDKRSKKRKKSSCQSEQRRKKQCCRNLVRRIKRKDKKFYCLW
ncbi:uncharacterized protein LOC100186899 [Ciona intestinalis]